MNWVEICRACGNVKRTHIQLRDEIRCKCIVLNEHSFADDRDDLPRLNLPAALPPRNRAERRSGMKRRKGKL